MRGTTAFLQFTRLVHLPQEMESAVSKLVALVRKLGIFFPQAEQQWALHVNVDDNPTESTESRGLTLPWVQELFFEPTALMGTAFLER